MVNVWRIRRGQFCGYLGRAGGEVLKALVKKFWGLVKEDCKGFEGLVEYFCGGCGGGGEVCGSLGEFILEMARDSEV